jgi:hypothetical protein
MNRKDYPRIKGTGTSIHVFFNLQKYGFFPEPPKQFPQRQKEAAICDLVHSIFNPLGFERPSDDDSATRFPHSNGLLT